MWYCFKTLLLFTTYLATYLCVGFMSNRGRQNVASFLALDLDLDWRDGAWWFESCLLDYDVASNWGNWVAAAGLTGGRLNKFNITKQSKVRWCWCCMLGTFRCTI